MQIQFSASFNQKKNVHVIRSVQESINNIVYEHF